MFSRNTVAIAPFALIAVVSTTAFGSVEPHAGMLRYPDVSESHIVFLYANDLWLVPREGGVAQPLASPPGPEGYPKFSPDGAEIAFMGNYDGNVDLYTVPVTGGAPYRVTYHPGTEVLTDWTHDAKLVFYARGREVMRRLHYDGLMPNILAAIRTLTSITKVTPRKWVEDF